MSNRTGTAYALTCFHRIVTDAEDELEDYLAAMPRAADSPLARVERLHLSRLHIFRKLVHQGPMQRKRDNLRHAHLVFTSTFNGELDDYLDELAELVPECDDWWGLCAGYPGRADRAAFRAWIKAGQVETTLFQSPIPTVTVADVREATALRERVLDFAVETQGADAETLYRRFREEF